MPHLLPLTCSLRHSLTLLSACLKLHTLLVRMRSRLLLSRCNRSARHLLKGFLVYGRRNLHPRALPRSGRKVGRIAKGCTDCFTHLVNGDVADKDTMLVLKHTHGFLLSRSLFSPVSARCPLIRRVHGARSAGPSWR